MAVRVTIEARDKHAAEVLARQLGPDVRAVSRRGWGVIRIDARNGAETARIVDLVSRLLEERRDLGWVRIRYGDEALVFRSNGRRTA